MKTLLTYMFLVNGKYYNLTLPNFFNFQEMSKLLYLLKQIKQFDGAVIDFISTPCWVIAAQDCSHNNGWIVMYKRENHNSPPHVRIISPTDSLMVDMIPGEVKVCMNFVKHIRYPKTV